MENTRLFFVVDSFTDNEEIFPTLEQAEEHFYTLLEGSGRRIRIAIVKNAYIETYSQSSLGLEENWNYNDLTDTFEVIKTLLEYT